MLRKLTFSVSDPSEPGQVKIGADLVGDRKLVAPGNDQHVHHSQVDWTDFTCKLLQKA